MSIRVPAVTSQVIAIRPGRPLAGAVTVDGSKNAALPLVAAAAALLRPVRLDNVPASSDVQTLLDLLRQAGWNTAHPVGDSHTVLVLPGEATPTSDGLGEAASSIRASYYLVPALIARCGRARLPWPGGCRIGDRGMEQHFKVYEAFGDRVRVDDNGYVVEAGKAVRGTVSMVLPFRSRGATIAAVLRAVVAGTPLRLGQPNLSPEVLGVLNALTAVGYECRAGERVLTLAPPSSVPEDVPVWKVPGDKIEAGTLACAVAATGGTAWIKGVHGPDVAPLVTALRRMGIATTDEPETLVVHGRDIQPTGRPLRAMASLAPGGLDADFEPPLLGLALGFPGTHVFSDPINPGRHSNLIPQLVRMGGQITELSSTECRFTGPQRLTGAGVEATDIRTGSALMVAGLTARGVTTLGGVDQIRRGHADLPGKLLALGADICEVTP
ncbi:MULTISPECIES: UDP-N-acetylglucosamine 1-carboxyvinyltransferase [unclassified Streptomyces]|uniref:UDP-N-acetylglucosamine 1-carboxyvinyltransferase n=1 Tax=unclassified Streptomyces TaxID=2593676 RepID=UPI0004A9DE56|nr:MULTISPECIES: UDP-N-acetylglucosamine 1-carboxyvinyltransferase [unclassified Streptomyces]APU41208.1 UDP-N-acetylglucosamine 1-carboxyvinyltransferase [Streptomyces sp. TN58]KJK52454.1 UDP-N-acetylglucosamine 1-carboxyvinyltransferase [Streptomyces sp. NRRL F-4428]